MYNSITMLKLAAASRTDQINRMANSVDIPIKSKQAPRGVYVKTEMQKDQVRLPADMHKVAAISARSGLSMLSKGSKSSSSLGSGISNSSSGSSGYGKNPKVTEGVMQEQLDSSQYRNSLDRKDYAQQGFFGASESKRAPGLASQLKS
jgi:hypothetical protein